MDTRRIVDMATTRGSVHDRTVSGPSAGARTRPWISVVVPALDEGEAIEATLTALAAAVRDTGGEIIVVDGGSSDDTVVRARRLADRVLRAPRGRARQMNAGAARATGDLLWFVHADTIVPPGAGPALRREAARREWGRFDVRLSGRIPVLRIVERLMNLRSRLTGIATGDQCIFVRRSAFEAVGGFADLALMEDLALSRALRVRGRPACLRTRVTTSSRRWEERGPWRTIFAMWRLRWSWWRGADSAALARSYRGPAGR